MRIQPRPLGEGGVAWITEKGTIVALVPVASGWSRSEFDLASPIVGEPVMQGQKIWVVTEDDDLVHLEADLGKSFRIRRRWRIPLPAPASEGMLLDGDALAVPLGPDGIAVYDASSGANRWLTPCRGTLLALGGGRAWVIDAAGFLTALSLTDGSPIGSVCLAGFSLPIRSLQAGRLLLASPVGVVTSLVPTSPSSANVPAEDAPDDRSEDPATDPTAPADEPEPEDAPGDRDT